MSDYINREQKYLEHWRGEFNYIRAEYDRLNTTPGMTLGVMDKLETRLHQLELELGFDEVRPKEIRESWKDFPQRLQAIKLKLDSIAQ